MHKLVSRLRKGCFSLYIDVKVGSSSANGLLWVSQVQWIYNQISFNPQHDLTFSDLTLEEHMFSIFLKHSKSDRSCQGTQIIIAKTNTIFCPFSSMMKFLRHCFLPHQSAPLIIIDGCKPLTRSWFSSKLGDLCLSCSLSPECYSPHSLRIGAAYLSIKIPGLLVILCLPRLCQAPQGGDLVHAKAHELLSPSNALINICSWSAV